MKKYIVLLITTVLILQSCATKKNVLYFQDANANAVENIYYTTSKIQPNDILNISVGALVQETAAAYNLQFNTTNGNLNIELLKLQGYLVTIDGFIMFPVLGKIEVASKTPREVERYIEKLLEDGGQLRQPTVSVRLLNAKVSVLGEVNRPGTYNFTEQNITFPQALGYAGDLTINGERKDVLLIREENGVRKITNVDLTSSDWFNTPAYFIKPNDLIVVNPNNAKVKSAGVIGNAGIVLTILSLILTSIVLITR